MCYDISLNAPIELITEQLPDLEVDPQLEIDFSTTMHVLAQSFRKYPVVYREDGQLKMRLFEWGVIASYMNTPEKIKQSRASMCNARSEKILERASAWNRMRRQRCLVPVNGFFEHREIAGWKNKVPYYIHQPGRKVSFLAGIYNYSPIPDVETGEVKGTFAIVTRPANELMKKIHNGGPNKHRMPIILNDLSLLPWLDRSLSDEQLQAILESEFPASEMHAWPVFSIRTTKQRPDGKMCFEPFEWESLPDLSD